jgi:hypothetical protein
LNVDAIREQIEAVEKALAVAGGSTFSTIYLRHAMNMPAPTTLWAADALKACGLIANELLIFPHRMGETYSGLFVTTSPQRNLPAPWVVVDYLSIRGDVDPHWANDDLNEQYAKWCAQKAPPTHCQ